MEDLKEKLKKIDLRQMMIYILVAIMLTISIWFIISNSVFLIKKLNRAFDSEKISQQEVAQFDKKGFQGLDLLTER